MFQNYFDSTFRFFLIYHHLKFETICINIEHVYAVKLFHYSFRFFFIIIFINNWNRKFQVNSHSLVCKVSSKLTRNDPPFYSSARPLGWIYQDLLITNEEPHESVRGVRRRRNASDVSHKEPAKAPNISGCWWVSKKKKTTKKTAVTCNAFVSTQGRLKPPYNTEMCENSNTPSVQKSTPKHKTTTY